MCVINYMIEVLFLCNYIVMAMFYIDQDHALSETGESSEDYDDVEFLKERVKYGEAPYIVAIFNDFLKDEVCTGIIIQNDFVLTGGYCVTINDTVVRPKHVAILGGVVDFRDHVMDQWRYAIDIKTITEPFEISPIIVLIKVNKLFYINFSTDIIPWKKKIFGNPENCKLFSWQSEYKYDYLRLRSRVLKQSFIVVRRQINACQDFKNFSTSLTEFDMPPFGCFYLLYSNYVRQMNPGYCMGYDGSCIICTNDDLPFPVGVSLGTRKFMCVKPNNNYPFINVGNYSEMIDQLLSQDNDF